MLFNLFFKRPLFYLAIFLSIGIISLHAAGIWEKIVPVPLDELSRFAKKASGDYIVGGVVDSDVEEKTLWPNQKNFTFTLKVKKLWQADTKEAFKAEGRTKVTLHRSSLDLAYGDEVVLKGRLTLPRPRTNPNGFDARLYWERQGIRSFFYVDRHSAPKKLASSPANPVFAKALDAKHYLSETLHRHFQGDTAAFLAALFLGERSDLTEEFKELFMKTGTLHILAVSGFNIGFLCAVILFLLKPLPIKRDSKLIFLLAAIWAYCLVVGWQPSMVRASLMASVWIGGKLLGRRTDMLNTIGFAACIILLIHPEEIFDIGFQLSFLAVFALARYFQKFCVPPELLPNETFTFKEKTARYFRELFWGSFVCVVLTLPVTAQNFYIVTPLSLIANLAVVPITFAIFFLGVILFFISWMPPALGLITVSVAGLMKAMVLSLNAVESIPGAYFISGKIPWPLWAVMTAGIIYILETKQFKNSAKRALAVVSFLFIIFAAQAVFLYAANFGKLRMTVLDVGQGDAIYIQFPDGRNMLVDGGKGLFSDKGRWVVSPFLKSKGVRVIDVLIATHPQEDHIGGLIYIFDEFRIKKVIEPKRAYKSYLYERFKKKVAKERADYREAAAGDAIDDFHDVSVRILNPYRGQKPHKNINEDSVVLGIRYRGTYWILTGDIQKEAMGALLASEESLDADVLKVPHHGARLDVTGQAFIKRVSPKVSIISVGERNIYHHPNPVTLDILKAVPGNQVFRTDEQGAIEVVSDGVSSYVKAWKPAA